MTLPTRYKSLWNSDLKSLRSNHSMVLHRPAALKIHRQKSLIKHNFNMAAVSVSKAYYFGLREIFITLDLLLDRHFNCISCKLE